VTEIEDWEACYERRKRVKDPADLLSAWQRGCQEGLTNKYITLDEWAKIFEDDLPAGRRTLPAGDEGWQRRRG